MTTIGVDLRDSEPTPGPLTTAIERTMAATGFWVPTAAVLAALFVGSFLILFEGENPLAVYQAVVEGVFVENRGFSDTATVATPLLFIGLGYAVAYRARVFTIGGEGYYLVGAVMSVGVVTAPGLRDLPALVLIPIGLIAAMFAGAVWGGLSGWLAVRFGASVVISSLMLVYVAEAVLQYGVREGIRDPESFIPASRAVGNAELPELFGTSIAFYGAVALPLLIAALMARHRTGFRVSALGLNGEALDANEVPARRIILLVALAAGAFAGIAGFTETAGVTGRLNGDSSVGFGWEAIVVALLGRLHPIGVLVAGLAVAGMTVGFEVSQRTFELPSSLIGVITALIVLSVVVGDAIAERIRGQV